MEINCINVGKVKCFVEDYDENVFTHGFSKFPGKMCRIISIYSSLWEHLKILLELEQEVRTAGIVEGV